MDRYSIVWKEYKDGWLPYFIWGDKLAAFEAEGEMDVDEEHLLKGILYEWNGEPMFPMVERETLLDILDEIREIFNYQSLEKMIVDVAAHTRDRNGSIPSQIMLEAGSSILPDSSMIKDDLSLDKKMNS